MNKPATFLGRVVGVPKKFGTTNGPGIEFSFELEKSQANSPTTEIKVVAYNSMATKLQSIKEGNTLTLTVEPRNKKDAAKSVFFLLTSFTTTNIC